MEKTTPSMERKMMKTRLVNKGNSCYDVYSESSSSKRLVGMVWKTLHGWSSAAYITVENCAESVNLINLNTRKDAVSWCVEGAAGVVKALRAAGGNGKVITIIFD